MFVYLSTVFVFVFVLNLVFVCFYEEWDGVLVQQTVCISHTYAHVVITTVLLFLILLNKIT